MELGVVTVAIVGITLWQGRDLTPSATRLPNIPLEPLDHQQLGLFTPGKTTVLFMFAPWCQVCHLVVGNFDKLVGRSDLQVIGLGFDYRSEAELETFRKENEVRFPVVAGTDSLQEVLHLSAYPTFYIVDEQGIIVGSGVGYTSSFGLWWRLLLAS